VHKLLVSFLIVFIGVSILGAIVQGGGGIESTTLTANITADDTDLPVSDTTRFADQNILQIGNEYIVYNAKDADSFTAYERGYDDTTAVAHSSGSRVYTEEAGVINNALGYDIGVQLQTGGTYGIIQVPINFFTITLPHLAVLNTQFLQATPELEIIGVVWFVFGIALIVVLAIWIAPIAVSLVTGIFGLIRRV